MAGRVLDEGAVAAGTVPLVTEVVLGEVPERRPAFFGLPPMVFVDVAAAWWPWARLLQVALV